MNILRNKHIDHVNFLAGEISAVGVIFFGGTIFPGGMISLAPGFSRVSDARIEEKPFQRFFPIEANNKP